MADTSQQELTEPHTNGVVDGLTEEEKSKMRPADIDADMREMERRKRVELIMNSKMFKEELERIIETQWKDGSCPSGFLQQISDMMGAQGARFNSTVFKNSNCVVPINDIRGVEAKGYERGEKMLRCKLAAVFRLLDLYGWTQGVGGLISARLNQDQEHFLVNPYGLLYHEVTASSLVKVDMQGQIVEQGTTNFGVHVSRFQLHSTIHAARPDIKCIIHITTPTVTAVSSLKCGLLPLGQESIVIGDVSTHQYIGETVEPEEREKITRNLGPLNKVMLLTNRGALCCGETVEEAFYNVYNTVLACETQLKLMPMGLENLNLLSDETKKAIFEASRKPPVPMVSAITEPPALAEKMEKRWKIGRTEFEALMRMLDNAGFRTGYIYTQPLIKGDPPRPRNDVEVPPAVSSLGYLLEEEELYRQGLWKGGRKGADRSRWLNSPNVYQKVEILETGTPDPKKITKWVSDGSPTHSSTPVRIESALQFVPKNTNPKEFKALQQQIKDYRRADKISAGPQSHILEGVSWEEAKKLQDATISGTGEQVVLVGAASKGIIQRGFQHNAMVYKTPYAKNPFDAVTDQELDQYKKEVERKTKGDPYDESQSESEALSSFNISRATHESSTAKSPIQSPISITSETEEESRDEPRVLRIEKKHVPAPSQAEVVLSDGMMHGHDTNTNKSIPVEVAAAITPAVPSHSPNQTQIYSVPIVTKHKFEANATTDFLNEMRRSAIEPQNDRNKRDEVASSEINEIGVEDNNRGYLNSYSNIHLKMVRTTTIAERMIPLKMNIIIGKSIKLSNSNIKPKDYIIKRRRFFNEYEKLYAEYKNTSLETYQRFLKSPISKKATCVSDLYEFRSPRPKCLFKNGLVKKMIADYTLVHSEIGHEQKIDRQYRKRSYESPNLNSIGGKIRRLLSPNINTEDDLKSPRLVEAVMNKHKNQRKICNKDKETDLLTNNIISNETDITSTSFVSSDTVNIMVKYLPVKETSQIIDTDENGNKSNVRRNILSNIPELLLKPETKEKISEESADENGNSWLSKDEIKSDLGNKEIIEVIDTKSHTSSPDQDPSSTEEMPSMLTVVENSMSEKKIENSDNNSEDTDVQQKTPESKNQKWLSSESIESLGKSFQKGINDCVPWRFSSPMPKNSEHEDSMTEMINNINVNLTPSNPLRYLNYRLPDTDNSMKYNLDSTCMSMIYSLTPTPEIEDETNKEHINCSQNCSQCLIIGNPGLFDSLSPDSIHDEISPFFWDDQLSITKDNMTNVSLDLNKTVDLFDNLNESDEDNDEKCERANIEDEICSLEGSDILELPNSTVARLKESDENSFNQDIATSVNEIIAELKESEILESTTNIIENVSNLPSNDLLNNIIPQDDTEQFGKDIDVITSINDDKTTDEIIISPTVETVEPQGNEEHAANSIDDNLNLDDDQQINDNGHGLIVIDELIHHIIDDSSPQEDTITSEESSSESFNMKKAKECVNTEIKEMETNIKDNLIDDQQLHNKLNENSGVPSDNTLDQQQSNKISENSSDFINKMKLIIDDIDTSLPNETIISEELKNIVASFSSDNGSTVLDDSEIFQHNVDQLKQIVNESEFNIDIATNKSTDVFDCSNSTNQSILANRSEFVKQFINRFKQIINNQENEYQSPRVEHSIEEKNNTENKPENTTGISFESATDLSITNDTCSSTTVNISSETAAILDEQEMCENIPTIDDNKEKNKLSPKHYNFSYIYYEGQNTDCEKTEEISEENASDIDGDVESQWNENENEMERSYNEIRSNDIESSSFIQYELVDNISTSVNNNCNALSTTNNVKVVILPLPSIKEDDESLIEESEIPVEIVDGNPEDYDDDSVIFIKEVNKDSKLSDNSIEIINVSDDCNGSLDKSSDPTTLFFSCKDENSANFENSSVSSSTAHTLSSAWSGEDDTDSKYLTGINSEAETYTVSDYDSETDRETMYNADISSNVRKSDSFLNNDYIAYDTTVNMADISSPYEDDDESMQTKTPLKSTSKKNQICNVCLTVISKEYEFETIHDNIMNPLEDNVINDTFENMMDQEKQELINTDICSGCLMTLSMDSRDFIRLEREVILEEKINCDILNISPINPPPKYEDTTLCKVVSKISLNDSLVSLTSSESIGIN
ncbi:hypothetical protein PV327_002503 [Microctonus hyperodae]|uniref:Class II aldolase/adducin N-terminal domain-containing protein n=1 Tax=Microctonus hyperodae TaxID=165561 RepID=A0AA39KPB3_MICHY|nr:hypothetical protein PV327_002503 [Microctonus hyperodae]